MSRSVPREATDPGARGSVLVVGAAGKTGLAVTRALAGRGVGVRAAVRGPSSYETVTAAGATRACVVDLETGAGLDEAMAGVGSVYHLAPNMHPDEVGITARVLDAAERAGVGRVVYHSVLHPHDRRMPHHWRKADAEALVRARVPAWTVLEPAAYLQNLLAGALAGRIAVPYSVDAPFTLVDLDDVAEVAARVLVEPGHERATYELAGGELTTVAGLAAIASEVAGHPVAAASVPVGEWMAGPGAGLDPGRRADFEAMFRSYDARGLAGSPRVLRTLLRREPTTWAGVLRRAAA